MSHVAQENLCRSLSLLVAGFLHFTNKDNLMVNNFIMENQKNTFKYLLIGFIVVVIIAGAFSDNSTDSKEIEIINTEEVDQATDLIEVEKESDKEIVSIDYEILDQSVYAPNGEKFLIMLPEDSEKEYIQQVAEEILENFNEDKGKKNKSKWGSYFEPFTKINQKHETIFK